MKSLSMMLVIIFTMIGIAKLNDVSQVDRNAGSETFYVSKNGNNLDGSSWATAWNELDQIEWDRVQADAIIYLDGGDTEMRYETELQIGASGTQDAPIRILASTETGHEGQIIFFGGRSLELPYCGQESYDNPANEQLRENGIRSNDNDYIVIDGQRWRGIQIHGYRDSGIRLDAQSSNITVQYVEVYDNGEAVERDDGWKPDHAGVRLAGANMLFRRVIIHDNGHDAFQSLDGDNNIQNFRLEQSWLHNSRVHPNVDESFNYCTHTDGMQIYDGGLISGIGIYESIIGPGFTQNLLLGQTRNDEGSWADIENVTLQDVVFTKAADNNVIAYRDSNPANWLLDHVTIDCLATKSHCLRIQNSNHQVQNSIVINGLITFPDGLGSYSGNCMWNARGFEIGEEADPLFEDVSDSDVFSLDNYTPASNSPCQGSRMTSVEQLLSLP
jgi:hypothetical protein